MSSRASRRNDTTDIIKKIQNDNRRDRGLARQAYSGLASAEYGSSTANSGGTSSSSGGGTSGIGLADTNVWTGINSFTSVTSFTVTSPQIYLGDEAGDTINITGQVNLNGDIDMNTNDITSLGDIGFDVIGGQITADAGATGMNFVTTSDVPFRFTPNATNVLDITDAGIDMIAGDIDLNNLNIIGVNAINFNTTGQSITDSAGGIVFNLTDNSESFDFVNDGNTTVSFEKFFMDLTNTRIQMTEEVAPSAPAANEHYVYVDSTSKELSILHSSGSAVSLEGSGGGSTSFVGFTGDDILDMATYDIERVGQIEFNTTSHYIKSNSVGFEYRVPFGDDHEFFVNGVSELKVDGGGCIVGNDLTVNDNVTLGSSSADLTTHNGLVNYATNYSAVGQPAATSAGYITIQIGGVSKKLYYY